MQIGTIPGTTKPDEHQPVSTQDAREYSAYAEDISPTEEDDENWWLPVELDMTGPHPSWQHSSGTWCARRA